MHVELISHATTKTAATPPSQIALRRPDTSFRQALKSAVADGTNTPYEVRPGDTLSHIVQRHQVA